MTWAECTLGEFLRVKHGFAFKSEFFEDAGPFVVLTPGNFYESGGFRARPGKDRSYSGDIPSGYVLSKDDVVIAMTEQGPGLLGSSAVIPDDNKYLHNQRIGLLHDINETKADKKFLYYLFNTAPVRGQIVGSATGTKVRHTAPERIYRVKARIPDVAQQRKIATALTAYDDLIENNRRRIALLEETARLLYREWFVHFRFPGHEHIKVIDGVAKDWQRKPISEIATVYRGKSYRSSELRNEGGKAFVNLKCIERFGGFRVSGLKRFEGDHKEHHRVEPGDIVMAVTDMTRDAMIVAQAGRIPLSVNEDAVFSMDLVKVAPIESRLSYWLYALFRYSGFSFEVREHATGTNVLHLKPKFIETWRALVPSDQLIDGFTQLVRPLFEQQDKLELQIMSLAKARNFLLPRLMDGRLEI